MNLYQYCFNDPVNWVDPYGLYVATPHGKDGNPGMGMGGDGREDDPGIPWDDILREIRRRLRLRLPIPIPIPPNPMNNKNGKCPKKGDKVGGSKSPRPEDKKPPNNKGPVKPKPGKEEAPDPIPQDNWWKDFIDNVSGLLGDVEGRFR